MSFYPRSKDSPPPLRQELLRVPKIKTHKGAKRRFHLSSTGKLLRTKGPKSHLRRNKSKRVKRLFGGKVALDSKKFAKNIKQAISAIR